jgi:Kef-type K+ transport system membrane component KefB
MKLLLIDLSGEPLAMLIFNVGVILLLGLFFGKIAEKLNLPDITGYLFAGLLLGPISGFLTSEELSHMSIISNIALGFIAFQVGNELWLGKLKKSGKRIVIITIIQALFTALVVALILLLFTNPPIALIMGAIAAATAPAPIMMIINKFRTKGPLTNTIVPIVGLDDAVGVIVFGVLLSLSVALASGNVGNLNFFNVILDPLKEIGISILLGTVIGLISGYFTKTITKDDEAKVKHLDVIIITVFITVGAAMLLDASPILTPMIAGVFVTNLVNKDTYILEEETIRFFIPPIMILFFTISGAQLSFTVITTIGLVGLMYIISRTFGKFGGCYIASKLVHTEPTVKRYLGFAMLPQSGVAIGLAMAAYAGLSDINSEYADQILNITLASVLVFAFVGPVLVQWAFKKSGEAKNNKSS